MFEFLLIALFGVMWGSFLNVVACRLITGQSIIYPRSHCPHCKKTIAWYDNIPLFSWLFLRGSCRICKKHISLLYPFIELLTAATFILLYAFTPGHLFAHLIFFSGLIVTVRTDLEHMLISRLSTIGIIPIAVMCSYFGMLPLSLAESLIGAFIGYFALWAVARIFYAVTKKHGLGEGDFDLLAMIGAFTGIEGVFFSVLIGSWVGTIMSLLYITRSKRNFQIKIPFGPFLALGAISYVIWQSAIDRLLLFLI